MAFNTLIPAAARPPSFTSVKGWSSYLASQKAGPLAGKENIGGIIFDYAGETKAELISDITDHYAEDNTAFQDHIALHPIRVTLKGIIGELVAAPNPAGLAGLLQAAQSGFTTLQGYLGLRTPQYLSKQSRAISKVQNVASEISVAVSRGKSLYNFFKNGGVAPTKQAEIYIALETMRERRQLVEVQTPFKVYKDMAIESIMAIQPENTKYMSEFTVVVKQIRTAKVIIDTVAAGAPSRNFQAAPVQNNGQSFGSSKPFVKSDFLVE